MSDQYSSSSSSSSSCIPFPRRQGHDHLGRLQPLHFDSVFGVVVGVVVSDVAPAHTGAGGVEAVEVVPFVALRSKHDQSVHERLRI